MARKLAGRTRARPDHTRLVGDILMRLREILESASAGATSSGSIAPVAQPLTDIAQRRIMRPAAKYKNSAPRDTGKLHAGR